MFVGLVTQLWSPSNVCVERRHKLCACITFTSVFMTLGIAVLSSLLWCGYSVLKLNTFYLHQTPSWLWLVRTNSPVFTPPGYRDQSAQQYKQCPDSTVFKVLWTCVKSTNTWTLPYLWYNLTVLKWWMIMTSNRKLWKSRGYRTTLLPMRYT